MRQEGWPAAPSEAQPPVRCWRSDASTDRGLGGVARRPRLRVPMLLTIKDVSGWLNIKPSTLYLWVAQGKIPCQKIHGLIRFDREAVTVWLCSFNSIEVTARPPLIRQPDRDLNQIIEAAKRQVYTPGHGETSTPSPRGKE